MRKARRIAVLLTSLLIVVGLTALPVSSMAGGDPATAAKKKKKKKCPPGTHKVVIKKKNGKKKRKCVPDAPPGTNSVLSVSPTSLAFPDEQHGGNPGPPQTFTVTNTGGASSGALTTSIVDFDDPVALDQAAFLVSTNTCGPALPSGASCTVTVVFDPDSNGGDSTYGSFLQVVGAPGGTAQATMFGTAL